MQILFNFNRKDSKNLLNDSDQSCSCWIFQIHCVHNISKTINLKIFYRFAPFLTYFLTVRWVLRPHSQSVILRTNFSSKKKNSFQFHCHVVTHLPTFNVNGIYMKYRRVIHSPDNNQLWFLFLLAKSVNERIELNRMCIALMVIDDINDEYTLYTMCNGLM